VKVVREAKASIPSAWTWAHRKTAGKHRFFDLATGAFRAPDPFLRLEHGFIVRRLSADSRKIELEKDAGSDLKLELLRGMGADLAAIHAATPGATQLIKGDLKARRSGWLRDAVSAARDATKKDFELWRQQ
jgi:hypothetical protein